MDLRTQAMNLDTNRTLMGTAPTIEATMTIKPVQCPVCKTFNPVGVMFCVDCGLIFDRALDGDAFGAAAVQLPVLVDSTGREYVLRPGANAVGRAGDVMIDDGRVSRKHAEVNLTDAGLTIADVGSTNGTKLNGNALAAGSAQPIADGDTISLGGFEMKLSMPGQASQTQMAASGRTAAISAPPAVVPPAAYWVCSSGERYPLHSGLNSIGRKQENDLCIPQPYVSGKHATLDVSESGVFLTDVGSTNGTLLNDARIAADQRMELRPEDVVKIGELEFRLELGS